jgi:protein-L-isoaspartate(D-aspartate) O-methyltransferase
MGQRGNGAMNMDARRRFFAECRLRSPGLVDAFAAVPREQFLPPGPWTVMADSSFGTGPIATCATPDADPARVCHNIAVAIDPARQLFNGQPGTIAMWIDALELRPGQRVLHVGAGLGYFTAVMAHCVGPQGRVVAYEVDDALGTDAARNLRSLETVEVRHGDAHILGSEDVFDAVLINAGVTHPLDGWLNAMAPGARMILPLTSTGLMGPNIGKGLVLLLARDSGVTWSARVLAVVAIYSALGVRDDTLNERLGKAMMAGPMQWQRVKRLRRDPHEPDATCWYHTASGCLSTEPENPNSRTLEP